MTPEQSVEVRILAAMLDETTRCRECSEPTVQGTGYCDAHLGPARIRACEEIRASYGMCADDLEADDLNNQRVA